jgi:hypothetical protein
MSSRNIIFAAAGVPTGPINYVDDVFSTWVYTGTSSNLTISNNINLATNGGMVWIKSRTAFTNHFLFDTNRGVLNEINSNTTDAQVSLANSLTAFNTDGFRLGTNAGVNTSAGAATFCSWTFREQPKFFDIVTYTGNGANRTIAHNLGSVPGMIIVKSLGSAQHWTCYHKDLGSSGGILLSDDDPFVVESTYWNNTNPTSSSFTVGTSAAVNQNSIAYVAYLFAHDAGGFGAAGTDNVISCGSYTGNGSSAGPVINLGYEPQWLLIKRTQESTLGDWNLIDNMRGFVVGGTDAELNPNLTATESTGTFVTPTATGFQLSTTNATYNASGNNYIYMAIRRPMKPPTSGTQVFIPVASDGATSSGLTTNFVVDSQWIANRLSDSVLNTNFNDRLRGVSTTTTQSGRYLISSDTTGELTASPTTNNWGNLGFLIPSTYGGVSTIYWNFRRAPGFFDVVCYTGTGSARTVTHNLGVAPELMIVRSRTGNAWRVYSAPTGNTKFLVLNNAAEEEVASTVWNNTSPTASVFTVATASAVNASADTYVAYLFATLAGVSKIGSYTGNGTSQTINCGFTTGARFILIKKASTGGGDWFVWDTARGIVAGNDPYLRLNLTNPENANNDTIDPASSGFIVNEEAFASVNASGATYIFLAIA